MNRETGVSVIVCCYNSSGRITETLQYLARQVVLPGTAWEIIIVDNCSKDNTSQTAFNAWSNLQKEDVDFRIVTETTPGLSHAREKGISEAKHPYLIFCDDDNLLHANYVQIAKDLFDKNLLFGIIGGNNFYVNGKKNFITENYSHDYAVGLQAKEYSLEDITATRGFVWGAGMCFRKKVFEDLQAKKFKSLLSDRKGKELSSGGDTEFCFAVRLLGWKIGVSSNLSLIHNIPDERFQMEYLLKLKKGFGQANPFLDLYQAAWLYNNGKPNPYNNKKEIKNYWPYLMGQKSTLYSYIIGRKEENSDFVELHYHLARLKSLLRNRSKLNKLFLQLIDNYGIKTS